MLDDVWIQQSVSDFIVFKYSQYLLVSYLQLFANICDAIQFVQEPFVNGCQVMNLVYGVTIRQSLLKEYND